MHKLKRVVLREELVEITGDALKALLLSQMLYWTERRRDFDTFIKEELDRDPKARMTLTGGWVYKTAQELSEELMGIASRRTISRRLSELVEDGFLDSRKNPDVGMDRTLQYRVDLHRLQNRLHEAGYALEGYPLLQSFLKRDPDPEEAEAMPEPEESALDSWFPRDEIGSDFVAAEPAGEPFRVPEGVSAADYLKRRVGRVHDRRAQELRDTGGLWGQHSNTFERALARHPDLKETARAIGAVLDRDCDFHPVWGDPQNIRTWAAGLVKLARISEDPGFFVKIFRSMEDEGLTIASPHSLYKTAQAEKRESTGDVFRVQV